MHFVYQILSELPSRTHHGQWTRRPNGRLQRTATIEPTENSHARAMTSSQSADSEIARLKAENAELKQQIALLMQASSTAITPQTWTKTVPEITSHNSHQRNGYGHHQIQRSQQNNWTPQQYPASGQATFGNMPSMSSGTSALRCFNCHEIGHMRRHCPQLGQVVGNDWDSSTVPTQIRSVTSRDTDSAKVCLRLTIDSTPCLGLLDSGSDVTVIPANLLGSSSLLTTEQRCVAANGTTIYALGRAVVRARVGNQQCIIDGLVSEDVSELMLGIDFLKDNDALWNFTCNELVLGGQVHQLETRERHISLCNRVILMDDAVVPSTSHTDVDIKTLLRDPLDSAYSEKGHDTRHFTGGWHESSCDTANQPEVVCRHVNSTPEQDIKFARSEDADQFDSASEQQNDDISVDENIDKSSSSSDDDDSMTLTSATERLQTDGLVRPGTKRSRPFVIYRNQQRARTGPRPKSWPTAKNPGNLLLNDSRLMAQPSVPRRRPSKRLSYLPDGNDCSYYGADSVQLAPFERERRSPAYYAGYSM